MSESDKGNSVEETYYKKQRWGTKKSKRLL